MATVFWSSFILRCLVSGKLNYHSQTTLFPCHTPINVQSDSQLCKPCLWVHGLTTTTPQNVTLPSPPKKSAEK
ncbi:hypothetical protein CANARDRAFT_30086 [[Candida] arabinofermentans NRRL YB-2248]|uniref:Secreted protein n=1 Tax=[Candida] arabinofermentans NRRL YB-2248 TaxID=983967 RepID=A0A1E4SUX5_9ASCO|nr:hypothetical protein CANARDRAFT_30086 [[Candida] arabinofermentans NRRL YB-2248]